MIHMIGTKKSDPSYDYNKTTYEFLGHAWFSVPANMMVDRATWKEVPDYRQLDNGVCVVCVRVSRHTDTGELFAGDVSIPKLTMEETNHFKHVRAVNLGKEAHGMILEMCKKEFQDPCL